MQVDNWVGGIGDRRVLCVDDMKIFSCPEAAAYFYNEFDPKQRTKEHTLRVADVLASCNRLIRTTIQNLIFEWYNQYLLDYHIADFQEKLDPIKITKPFSNMDHAKKVNSGVKNYYSDVRKIYRGIKKAYLKNPDILNVSIPLPKFLEIAGLKRASCSSFTRHFKLHFDTYYEIFGVEYGRIYYPPSRHEVMTIKMTKFKNIGTKDDVDSDLDIIKYFSKHHDQESAYMKGKRNVSKPIIRIEDGRVFGSLLSAYHITGISTSRIRWCCEGDIPYCKTYTEKYTFRYVEFIN